jgi:pimeloyl-ACP methyl ester carboxylesterase
MQVIWGPDETLKKAAKVPVGVWWMVILFHVGTLLLFVFFPVLVLTSAILDGILTLRRTPRVLRCFPTPSELLLLESEIYAEPLVTTSMQHQRIELSFFTNHKLERVDACFHHTTRIDNRQNLLLLHGNGETGTVYADCVEHLHPHFNLYILDLLGFGRTTGRLPSTAPDIILYYSEFIEAFLESLDLQQLVVVGHSY